MVPKRAGLVMAYQRQGDRADYGGARRSLTRLETQSLIDLVLTRRIVLPCVPKATLYRATVSCKCRGLSLMVGRSLIRTLYSNDELRRRGTTATIRHDSLPVLTILFEESRCRSMIA